jgi:hypothetical protein
MCIANKWPAVTAIITTIARMTANKWPVVATAIITIIASVFMLIITITGITTPISVHFRAKSKDKRY